MLLSYKQILKEATARPWAAEREEWQDFIGHLIRGGNNNRVIASTDTIEPADVTIEDTANAQLITLVVNWHEELVLTIQQILDSVDAPHRVNHTEAIANARAVLAAMRATL